MWFIRYLFNALIPGVSAYLASDDTIFRLLIDNHILAGTFDIQLWQRIFLIISILFTTFVLSMQLAYHRNKEKQCKEEIAGLYNVVKQFAQSNFASISKDASFSFNLRIFVPETSIIRIIGNGFKEKEEELDFINKALVEYVVMLSSGRTSFEISIAAMMLSSITETNDATDPIRILFKMGRVCSMFFSHFGSVYSLPCPISTPGHKNSA